MRSNYWCNSDFADWLRGTMKPSAETSQGWSAWRKRAKQTHPFRYWLAEEGLDYIQKFVMWPFDKLYAIKYYINNRWVTGSHCLTAHPRDIKPGTWSDLGHRFLPCLFNELVDFVEIEQAWHYIAWDSDAQKKYQTPWWAKGWFRWRTWRCKEAGLEYLKWAASLKCDESMGVYPKDEHYGTPTHQALAALEITELYTWWTEEYPNRPDPYELSGWTAICNRKRKSDSAEDIFDSITAPATPEDAEESSKALDRCNEIEDKYKQEEEDMMIRLIRIRESLWT